MAASNTASKVEKLIRPAVEALGLRLWDVRFLKEGASWYLRVYIDSDDGIDLQNCTDVSHAIDPIIDREDPIDRAYFLEVCSPGLCRELKTDAHFEAMKNRPVKVHTIRAEEGRRDFEGVLLERTADAVILKTAEGEISLPRTNISSVKLDDDNF